MQLVCPNCMTKNRLPDERLQDAPSCGKCGTSLMAPEPIALSDTNFLRFIEGTELPVVVDFWADWCGPCKMMATAFAQAAQALEPRLRLAKLNTEAEPNLSARYQIRSIPTLIVFRDGRELARQVGAMSAQDLLRWAQSVL